MKWNGEPWEYNNQEDGLTMKPIDQNLIFYFLEEQKTQIQILDCLLQDLALLIEYTLVKSTDKMYIFIFKSQQWHFRII